MISWMFEVEGVACPVDDMKESGSLVQRRWTEGRENKGSGYGIVAGDLACGRIVSVCGQVTNTQRGRQILNGYKERLLHIVDGVEQHAKAQNILQNLD
jgi:hypothetical protein